MIERMVRVEWLDATSYYDDVPTAWVKKVVKAGGVSVVSVGLLAESNRRCVMLLQTKFADDGCCRQALCIPRGMIKKITYLEPRDG